jgi:hypothetical protein
MINVVQDDVHHEVPYTIMGQIGNWKFTRAWYYWVARVEDEKDGLPLDIATELHERTNPIIDCNFGQSIRSGGHCGCPSPAEYGAQPIYDEKFYDQLKKLGYKEEYSEILKKSYVPISYGEVSKLCNEGKLVVERYVDCYHIDDIIGLKEFANTLKNSMLIITLMK